MESVIQVLESVMATRDPYTVAHQQGVAQISLAIAQEIGLEEKKTRNMMIAARLHDFGKILVPMGILAKPGKLSVPEMDMIRIHPVTGCNLLQPLRLSGSIVLTIMQHHERMNGSGYPFGLSGADILLEARILAVADVVEAMFSHRPYRCSPGIKMALEEVSKNRGILYDPAVVDALGRLSSENVLGHFFGVKVYREAA